MDKADLLIATTQTALDKYVGELKDDGILIYDNTAAKDSYTVKNDNGQFGLSNVAATMVNLMGYEAPAMWDESIIEIK